MSGVPNVDTVTLFRRLRGSRRTKKSSSDSVGGISIQSSGSQMRGGTPTGGGGHGRKAPTLPSDDLRTDGRIWSAVQPTAVKGSTTVKRPAPVRPPVTAGNTTTAFCPVRSVSAYHISRNPNHASLGSMQQCPSGQQQQQQRNLNPFPRVSPLSYLGISRRVSPLHFAPANVNFGGRAVVKFIHSQTSGAFHEVQRKRIIQRALFRTSGRSSAFDPVLKRTAKWSRSDLRQEQQPQTQLQNDIKASQTEDHVSEPNSQTIRHCSDASNSSVARRHCVKEKRYSIATLRDLEKSLLQDSGCRPIDGSACSVAAAAPPPPLPRTATPLSSSSAVESKTHLEEKGVIDDLKRRKSEKKYTIATLSDLERAIESCSLSHEQNHGVHTQDMAVDRERTPVALDSYVSSSDNRDANDSSGSPNSSGVLSVATSSGMTTTSSVLNGDKEVREANRQERRRRENERRNLETDIKRRLRSCSGRDDGSLSSQDTSPVSAINARKGRSTRVSMGSDDVEGSETTTEVDEDEINDLNVACVAGIEYASSVHSTSTTSTAYLALKSASPNSTIREGANVAADRWFRSVRVWTPRPSSRNGLAFANPSPPTLVYDGGRQSPNKGGGRWTPCSLRSASPSPVAHLSPPRNIIEAHPAFLDLIQTRAATRPSAIRTRGRMIFAPIGENSPAGESFGFLGSAEKMRKNRD